jgi:hypothetical protein
MNDNENDDEYHHASDRILSTGDYSGTWLTLKKDCILTFQFCKGHISTQHERDKCQQGHNEKLYHWNKSTTRTVKVVCHVNSGSILAPHIPHALITQGFAGMDTDTNDNDPGYSPTPKRKTKSSSSGTRGPKTKTPSKVKSKAKTKSTRRFSHRVLFFRLDTFTQFFRVVKLRPSHWSFCGHNQGTQKENYTA